MSISLRWYLEYNQKNTSADGKNRKPFRIFYGAHPIFHKVLYFLECNLELVIQYFCVTSLSLTISCEILSCVKHSLPIYTHEVFCTLSVSEERENVTFSRCDPQSSFGLIFKRVLLFLFSK